MHYCFVIVIYGACKPAIHFFQNWDNKVICICICIRSRSIFISAPITLQKTLQSIDSKAIKLASGVPVPEHTHAIKTYIQAGMLSLSEQRKLAVSKYVIKNLSVTNSVTKEMSIHTYIYRSLSLVNLGGVGLRASSLSHSYCPQTMSTYQWPENTFHMTTDTFTKAVSILPAPLFSQWSLYFHLTLNRPSLHFGFMHRFKQKMYTLYYPFQELLAPNMGKATAAVRVAHPKNVYTLLSLSRTSGA